jgi:hypothetical protein
MDRRIWVVLIAAVILRVSARAWIEYRHLPVLNRWLRRHIAGSIVLATGLATAWFRGFVFTPLAFMAVGLAMWVWGTYGGLCNSF